MCRSFNVYIVYVLRGGRVITWLNVTHICVSKTKTHTKKSIKKGSMAVRQNPHPGYERSAHDGCDVSTLPRTFSYVHKPLMSAVSFCGPCKFCVLMIFNAWGITAARRLEKRDSKLLENLLLKYCWSDIERGKTKTPKPPQRSSAVKK